MIVCHCQVVTDDQVSRAIDRGASTVAQVCGATGAGRQCGGCVFSLKRLLCQHESFESGPLLEVEDEAS